MITPTRAPFHVFIFDLQMPGPRSSRRDASMVDRGNSADVFRATNARRFARRPKLAKFKNFFSFEWLYNNINVVSRLIGLELHDKPRTLFL
jgi:hypothetical protein